MECYESWASRVSLAVVCMGLALAPACGSGAGASGTAIDAGAGDAAGDAGPAPAPDAGPVGPGSDAGVDAPPGDTNPFPDDPAGGEFAWAVSATGADWSRVAVDGAGNILVVARQLGAVAIGNVRVPAPTSFQALLVLKLTPSGTPVWARSFESHTRIDPRAIAVTPAGDVVVGAVFEGPLQPPSFAVDDALVAVLDGGTGATRWSVELASAGDDKVSGLAAGPDGAGGAAIYVYGQLGLDATISGQLITAGAFLIRYDADGALRWARSVPGDAGFFEALVLDPARGPVIASNRGSDLTSDPIPGLGTQVVGFDPDGNVRFVRKLASSRPALYHSLAIAPGGDIYVASTTSDTETAVEDHVIPVPGFVDYPYLLRLTADGHYAAAHVISGDQLGTSASVTTDAEGAAYLHFGCGHANVQPEIDCGPRGGSVIASYGPDGEYRWATSVKSAGVGSVAAAPGNRLIVVGSGDSEIDLGGVTVANRGLFIAALAGGAARPPSPLPPMPAITAAVLDGVSDGQIRQGATGKLRIQGTGLDRVTSARLGDIDIHVPPAAGTATSLVLDVMIPHGHAVGPLGLQLGNAAGSARFDGAVTVTPIVVTPAGSSTGRGTFSSPLSFCRNDWFSLTRYGDLVLLHDGTYACDGSIIVRGGVTIRGESKAGTVVTGINGRNDTFGGLGANGVDIGTTAIESLTIASARRQAVFTGDGAVSVTDVDVQGVSGSGVWVHGLGAATVTRFNYLQSSGTAIVLDDGKVIATAVHAEGVFRGVLMTHGTLTLSDSLLSSTEPALEAGDDNIHPDVRNITLTNTVLRSQRPGLSAAAAVVTMTGCTIEPLPDPQAADGVLLAGGSLVMSDSQVHGWLHGIVARPVLTLAGTMENPLQRTSTIDELTSTVNLALDHVDIAASGGGIQYEAGGSGLGGGRFSLHHSHVRADSGEAALTLSDTFTADLGTVAEPGDNQLEAAIGVALFDGRTLAGAAIDAHGTTLNGNVHDGDVLGPVQTADFQLSGPNTIHF